ncbi:MAG: glycoside hydrolase N-terminal domain-containing protein [Cyclobacteriaceae bacterium]
MDNQKFCFIFLLTLSIACSPKDEQSSLKLWYDEPAQEWTEALPIGNGRIGAMVYGTVASEHIQFNEETLWTGKPRNYNRKGAAKHLNQIRSLLFEGKQDEAEELAGEVFLGTESNEENYAIDLKKWKESVKSSEFAQFDFDDSNWIEMPVGEVEGWESLGFPGMDGSVWLRFAFELPQDWRGKDLVLNLGRIMDEDISYVNGVEIGTEDNPYAHRRYQVPASVLRQGRNVIAVHVLDYYDIGGMVGFKTGEPMVVYPKGGVMGNGVDISASWKCFLQNTNPPEYPRYMAAYQPFGDLRLDFEEHEGKVLNYHRALDISNAISKVSYDLEGVHYQREYFVSAPDQALISKLIASKPGSLSFTLSMDAIHSNWSLSTLSDNQMQLAVAVSNGALRGVAHCKVHTVGGRLEATEKGLRVMNADEVVIALTAATNFKHYDDVSGEAEAKAGKDLSAIDLTDYESIKSRHISDYRQYFDRFTIDLNGDQSDSLTTDQRIVKFQNTQDPALLALYVQYGRYLLISSSRPGTRPANLQGIWNDDLTPPWDSKYTTNINAEMNYWPAEPLNLSEMHEPLFSMIEELAERGKETAKIHYDMDGWVLHHNTDLWRGTAPINRSNHGIWPTGGAWLCHHLWQHFEYSLDTVFLKERAYPIIKDAALFFKEYLIEDLKSGYLISGPSNSPENGGLVMGPTMDHQIIRDLFQNCIEASRILKVDEGFADTLALLANQIAPHQIGRFGQLQEWMDDKDDPENKHRHVSHLWGIYPDDQINAKTPELLEAAKKSLIFRGDDGTGWSLAWKINLWARFGDGNHAWKMINNLFRPAWIEGKRGGGSYKNLFDAHPPFQIDGNFGAAAGVAEMLVQTLNGEVILLPALPDALPAGEINGLRIPGGGEINFKWVNHKLGEITVTEASKPVKIRYAGKLFEIQPNTSINL